jgi:hypothetical protein
MRNPVKAFWLLALLIAGTTGIPNAIAAPADNHVSMVVVFKDGHTENLAVADVARIDFKNASAIVFKDSHRPGIPAEDILRIEFETPSTASMPGKNHFLGKWKVGEGNGGVFYITLDADGTARKTLGSPRGTWTLVNGEARISWDDGWHDIIRKMGARHEKRAYGPGKSFDDEPSNTASAEPTEPRPI